jgi:hypothetical protein
VETSEASLEFHRIAVNEPWAPGVVTIVQIMVFIVFASSDQMGRHLI